MTEKTRKMIRIKWVRSGIGFTRHQKTIVRSLGLKKLNHTVVRPDTPQIRGIVAAVPHLLEIVPEPPAPAWASIPEYVVHTPAAAPTTATGSAGVVSTEAGEEFQANPVPVPPEGLEAESATADLKKDLPPEASESTQADKE